MLFLCVTWVVLGGLWLTIGQKLLDWCHPHPHQEHHDHWAIAVLLGVGLTGILWLALALVMPLSWPVAALTLGIMVGLSRPRWHRLPWPRSRSAWQRAIAHHWPKLLFALLVAGFCSQPVTSYDTGLYHHPVIQWLANWGAVRGLALIHYTFGYASAWLALSAPLHDLFPQRADTILGGFVTLITLCQAHQCYRRITHAQGHRSDWFFVIATCLCFGVLFQLGLPVSPSPDVGVMVFTLFTLWVLVRPMPHPPTHWDIVPLGLAIAAFSCKASALPLVAIVCLFCLIRQRHHPKLFSLSLGLTLLLCSPLLGFGVLTTGCPIYPSSLFCLPQLPWALTAARAEQVAKTLQDCARWICPPEPPTDYTLLDWLIPWAQQSTSAIFLLVGAVGSGLWLLRHPLYRHWTHHWVEMTLAVGGFALVFYGSPSLRFGLLYLFPIPVLLMAHLCQTRSPWRWLTLWLVGGTVNFWLQPSVTLGGLWGVMLGLSGLIAARSRWFTPSRFITILLFLSLSITAKTSFTGFAYQLHPLMPPPINHRTAAPFITLTSNDVQYRYPDPNYLVQDGAGLESTEDRCWAEPIPCTPELSHPSIQLRDPEQGLGGGFVRGD